MIPLRRYWDLLSTYLAVHRLKMVVVAALIFVGIGLQLAQPLVIRHFVDSAVEGAPVRVLTVTALLYIAVALTYQVSSVAQTYFAEDVGWSTTNALRADLALHCLRLDMPFHLKHTPGQLIERIDGDVAALSSFFSRLALNFLSSALLLIGSLAVIATIDPRIALVFAIFAAVGVLILRAMRGVGVPFNTLDRDTAMHLFGFIQERLAGTEDIRARGAAPYVLRGLWSVMRDRMHARVRAGTVSMVQWGVMIMLFAAGTALTFALGGALFQAGRITIGTVLLLISYTSLVTRPMSQLSQQLDELQRATASITRVQELLDQSTALSSAASGTLPGGALGISFEGVTFSYPRTSSRQSEAKGPTTPVPPLEPAHLALDGVSFTLQPGRVLGLLGRTGSGKTTLTRLLLRLYDPMAGGIRLGGVDLRDVSPHDVRERVGMVTQEVQLFAGTVRDNLTFFNRDLSDARVRDALEALELDGWLRGLPQGLDSPLASGGAGLSAGEAQLLAFARVFLRNPGLVILDEASSRLDPATERRLERAVNVLLERRTGIVVAHRLATVQRADEIVILESGQIAEHGSRAALAADPESRFAALLRTGLEVAFA